MIEEKQQPEKQKSLIELIISMSVLVLIFITIWYMIDIVLLTFIITFVFYKIVEKIQKRSRRVMPIVFPDGLVLTIIYVLFVLILIFASMEFAPKLAIQFSEIASIFMQFDINTVKEAMDPRLN